LKRYLEPRPDADLNLTLAGQAIPSSVTYVQMAIFGLAAILIGIALVNVFNTSLMAMQEKLRTIGVLKTVGMTPAQVMVMVNTTAGVLGLAASAIGIPLGLLFTKGLLSNLSRTFGFGQVQVTLGLVYVLILPPVMVGLSVLGSSIPGQRAARLDIVNVLRSE
jgi:putative ABC transport system permease protein